MKNTQWQPSASLPAIKERAQLLQDIRAFFAQHQVLEVETPILSSCANTDPQIESFFTRFNQRDYYLHTSPEFYMKRLLAAGSGDIYQVARVFRDDELGRYHNPEFTLLEWYRLGFDHHQLMDEMQALIKKLFSNRDIKFQRISYKQAFMDQLHIDPLTANVQALQESMLEQALEIPQGMSLQDKDMWLDWLMLEKIAPSFAKTSFTFIYDYPASQAALSRLDKNNPLLAHRFELFYGELELANGFYELTDVHEQQKRFENENKIRRSLGKKVMPVDYELLGALASGLPECSGVALGLDRLLMLKMQLEHIGEVISFANEFNYNAPE